MTRFAIGAVMLFSSLGCGNKPVPVRGEVRLDGVPLSGALVSFEPVEAGKRGAYGTTDAQGRFALQSLNPEDGAFPGDYIVLVRLQEAGPDQTFDDVIRSGPKRSKSLVHLNYTHRDKSPLRATVPPPTPLVFQLKKDGG